MNWKPLASSSFVLRHKSKNSHLVLLYAASQFLLVYFFILYFSGIILSQLKVIDYLWAVHWIDNNFIFHSAGNQFCDNYITFMFQTQCELEKQMHLNQMIMSM